MTTMTTGFGKTTVKKNRRRRKTTHDLNAALSLSLSILFSHVDCHSSKIVHLVSSRDHVTSNDDKNIYKSRRTGSALICKDWLFREICDFSVSVCSSILFDCFLNTFFFILILPCNFPEAAGGGAWLHLCTFFTERCCVKIPSV